MVWIQVWTDRLEGVDARLIGSKRVKVAPGYRFGGAKWALAEEIGRWEAFRGSKMAEIGPKHSHDFGKCAEA